MTSGYFHCVVPWIFPSEVPEIPIRVIARSMLRRFNWFGRMMPPSSGWRATLRSFAMRCASNGAPHGAPNGASWVQTTAWNGRKGDVGRGTSKELWVTDDIWWWLILVNESGSYWCCILLGIVFFSNEIRLWLMVRFWTSWMDLRVGNVSNIDDIPYRYLELSSKPMQVHMESYMSFGSVWKWGIPVDRHL